MTACTTVRRLITPYVDGEASPSDRALVEDHVALCEACKVKVDDESAVRNLIAGRMAESRCLGVEPQCRPRSFALGRRVLYPRHAVMAACVTGVMVVVLLRPAAPAAFVATGVISDSTCSHSHEAFTSSFKISDRQCVLGCVKRGAEFVLLTDKTIYRLQNQSMPELSQLAAERVHVSGTLKDGTIDVSSIAAVAASHALAPGSLQAKANYRH